MKHNTACLFLFICFYLFRRWAWEYSWDFLVGGCHAVLQILTLFQTKKFYFSHPFCDLAYKIHTRFQTWLLRNYVITKPWSSLLGLELQQKKFLKSISGMGDGLLFIWNRTIARWRHFTTTTRILEFVDSLCKLRPLFFNPQRDWQN